MPVDASHISSCSTSLELLGVGIIAYKITPILNMWRVSLELSGKMPNRYEGVDPDRRRPAFYLAIVPVVLYTDRECTICQGCEWPSDDWLGVSAA